MSKPAYNPIRLMDFSNQNFQKVSFRDKQLTHANFSHCDLRAADFTGADLSGADLTGTRTGITPWNTVWIFLVALSVSLISGYVATLAGNTLHAMYESGDMNIRTAAIASVVVIVLFVLFSIWRGVGNAARNLVLPAFALALVVGAINYASGAGTGKGVLYLILSVMLVVIMFIVGTIARAAAGSLSANILFVIVALSGGIFGRSIGGGIGTVVMALSCALISKRALKGAEGFGALRKIAGFITSRFGTSFRNTRLAAANFSGAIIRNSDFSGADLSLVFWGDAKKINCLSDNTMIKQ